MWGPGSGPHPFGLELKPKNGAAELTLRKNGVADPGPSFGHHRNNLQQNFITFARNIFHRYSPAINRQPVSAAETRKARSFHGNRIQITGPARSCKNKSVIILSSSREICQK